VRADPIKEPNWEVEMTVVVRNLPDLTTFLCCSGNNPLFEIHKPSRDDPELYEKVYESEVRSNTRHAIFPSLRLKAHDLCNSDSSIPI
jgi:hypothetical protein